VLLEAKDHVGCREKFEKEPQRYAFGKTVPA
jgi:hypothetical protein